MLPENTNPLISIIQMAGSTQASACKCALGFYGPDITGPCLPCPQGNYYCPGGPTYSPCPNNTLLEDLICKPLQGYYFNYSTNQTMACPLDLYCLGKLAPPASCPPHSHTLSQASSSRAMCLCDAQYYGTILEEGVNEQEGVNHTCSYCPPGSYCPANSSSPVPCPSSASSVQGKICSSNVCVCVCLVWFCVLQLSISERLNAPFFPK